MVSDATEGGGERKPATVGGAEESGGRYVTVRARTIETEATGNDRRTRKRGETERKAQTGGGSFRGLWETRRRAGEGNSGRRLERRRETVEAMRSLTAVGTGGGRGGRSSFNTQDQSRGERPRSAAFASLYLVPPPHSYPLENAPFLSRACEDRRREKKISRESSPRPVESGGRSRRSRRTHRCGAGVFRVGGREACCESLPSIRPTLPRSSLLSFRPDVFPSGGRIPSRPFPFLCSDISPSPTEGSIPDASRRVGGGPRRLLLFITVNEESAERKRRKEGGKSTRKVESERRKPACVLVPSSLIEHAPSCRSAKRYGGE